MANVKFIRTPKGESLALLPRADYETLIKTVHRYERAEDRHDRRMVRKIERRITQGLDRTYPSVVVDAVLDGELPIRAWRKYYGWSAASFAAATGISAGYLSQIETGKRVGTLRVLQAMAEVLELSLADLTGEAFS